MRTVTCTIVFSAPHFFNMELVRAVCTQNDEEGGDPTWQVFDPFQDLGSSMSELLIQISIVFG